MSENVKVSNSTVLLRYISSFLLFPLLKREVKPETHKGLISGKTEYIFFYGMIVGARMK